MSEKWKDVPGYEGLYRVSDHGRVWSMPRVVIHKNGQRQPVGGRMLRLAIDTDGYRRCGLRRAGGTQMCGVHRLVLTAFVGPCPPGKCCCHNDGNPANNFLFNLRWDTVKANHADRGRHGKTAAGERQGQARLKAADIPVIRAAREAGESYPAIGRRFGVSKTTIRNVIIGTNWKDVG